MSGVTTTTTTKEIPERDTPAVLAYRLGTLEVAFKEGVTTLTNKLDDLREQFTPIKDHRDLEKRVAKIEDKAGLKQTLLWVGLVASAIINIVGAAKLFGAL